MMDNRFDEIRAFEQEDFLAARQMLTSNAEFCQLLGWLGQKMQPEGQPLNLVDILNSCDNIDQADWRLIVPFLEYIDRISAESIHIEGTENILPDGQLFLSNHRDIVLDASQLTMLIRKYNNTRIYMGIGTNLYVTEWIEPVTKLAKCFSVKRGGTPRELLANSTLLSEYLRHIIVERHCGAWLAQREGRAKDSDDRTQPALLKMLLLSADKSKNLAEQLAPLNITPVAISYEYDPCDYLKAKEFQQRRDNSDFSKTPHDDYVSMLQGLTGQKGRINYRICEPVNSEAARICTEETIRNRQIDKICEVIDQRIFAGYVIYNVNRIAYDMLLGTNRFAQIYTPQEKDDFTHYIESRIDMIELDNKDHDFLRHKLIEMYANPLINKLGLMME